MKNETSTPHPLPDDLQLTDMGNARRFALQHNGNISFVSVWGWMIWNGKYWERDETGQVMEFAKETAKNLFRETERLYKEVHDMVKSIELLNKPGNNQSTRDIEMKKISTELQAKNLLSWAKKSQARARLEAMIELAKSEPEIVAQPIDFDNGQWLLNVQNGTIDLRTQKLNPHESKTKITKIADVNYDPKSICPLWIKFLKCVFNYDQEIIYFIQRMVGYCLTGSNTEQCLFFFYGNGANGKSTFTGILQGLLGNFAKRTPTNTLILKHYDGGIPNDIARLAGARVVIAAELSEGRQLNESLVKDLTGGDVITARFLHKEFFEFTPIFKLIMYGNHKPTIKGRDEGIWRRILLIPFSITIPEKEQDQNLMEKLKTELSAILNWALEGCKMWIEEGLNPPSIIVQATKKYREEQDLLSAFLKDCCIIDDFTSVTQYDLFESYKKWALVNGLNPCNKIEFRQFLSELGFTANDRQGGTGRALYKGIGLLENPQ